MTKGALAVLVLHDSGHLANTWNTASCSGSPSKEGHGPGGMSPEEP